MNGMVKQHINDSAPGVIGFSTAGGFTLMGFVQNSIPVLQAVSLLIGIAVAVITFIYYWRKVRNGE